MAIKFDTFTTSGGGASDVTSVNTQTGDVVLSGDDLLADHTASNYTAANSNIDGHLSGIDTKLGTLTAGLTYKGSFNATAGTPSIANALQGDLYIIDTAGTLYGQTWAVGDHLLINEDMGGSITNSKIDKVDNTDQVTSVNGDTGAVSIDLDSVTTEGNSTTNTIVAGVLRTPYLRVGTSALSNYQFPTSDGDLYQVIATDGAGGLYWKDDESDVTSVNTQTGAVVLDGADLDSTHTPTNYTQANNTIDGHLSGIDSALAASASPTLDGVTTNGNTTTNAINVGDITTSGDILPDSDDTRTIGDENNRFISTYSDLNGAIRFKAKNNQGGQILKGQAVYISGVSGTVPEVKLAQADSALTMPAFGLAHATANDQADIEIVTFGNLTDYNTTTYSLSANNTVYVSAATAGALTNTAPSGESNLIQNIGRVVRADSSAGIIKVGGAGRSNATPNLDQDKIFVGNASNQSVSTALSAIGLSKFNNDSAFISDITSENLGDLSDVTITAAATGEVLKYNGSAWVDTQLAYSEISGTPSLATVATTGAYSDLSGTPSLATVATTGAYSDLTGTPTNVSTFTNDAGYLTDITGENLGDLSDVTITSATSGQVLSYNGSAWVNAAASGGASALDDLSDVTITAAATGEVLRYNGSAWVDAQLAYSDLSGTPSLATVATTGAYSDLSGTPSLATVATTGAYSDLTGTPTNVSTFTNDSGYLTDITGENLGDLSDVTITSATSGQVLSYNGSAWVNSASAGGASTLDDLTDVTITAAATGEVLRYNGSAWVDAQLAYSDLSGTPSLATVATTGAYSDLTGTPTNISTFTNDSGYLTDITGENLGDLSDVTITSATSGQVLSYNGSAWVNAAAAGGGGWTYSAITADPANAQAGYHYSCTGTFTITLPTTGVSSGEEIRIKNMGTGTITIDPQTSNIDDSSDDYVLDVQFSAITLVSTGTHWEII